MKPRIIFCALLSMFSFMAMTSQNIDNSVNAISEKDKSFILTDLSYSSDAVFMGRRDSIAAPYLMPSIGYYDGSGFFADVTASYLTGSSEGRVDLFLVSAGYLFSSNKWSGGILGTGYFFNDESYNVQSEMTANLSGLVSYDLEVLELSLTASSFFNSGGSTDIFGEFQIGRTFYTDKKNFLIKPTIAVGAGTQNFYEAYYQTSRLGNRKGKPTVGSGSTNPASIKIEEVSKFNILNVELSLPAQYYHKSFIFSFTPVVSFPQSSATIATEETIIEENLESKFYWTIGLSFWFPAKKKQ